MSNKRHSKLLRALFRLVVNIWVAAHYFIAGKCLAADLEVEAKLSTAAESARATA